MVAAFIITLGLLGWALPGARTATLSGLGTDWLLVRKKLKDAAWREFLGFGLDFRKEDIHFFEMPAHVLEEDQKTYIFGKYVLTESETAQLWSAIKTDQVAKRKGPLFEELRAACKDGQTLDDVAKFVEGHGVDFNRFRMLSDRRLKDPIIQVLMKTAKKD